MAPVVELCDVGVRFGDRWALDGVDWTVAPGQRWVVLGPNGCGKTTLLRVVSMALHPTRGEVEVLGGRWGRVDVRQHRRLIGVSSAAVDRQLRDGLTVRDAVMAAAHAALETWWHAYDDTDRARAEDLLARFGVDHLAGVPLGTLSSGERRRVGLARALYGRPRLLLLDEPAAGLDLGGREDLVRRLGHLAEDRSGPPLVLVTHHVDEIPPGTTHALVLAGGGVVAAGPLAGTLVDDVLSAAFGLPLEVRRDGDRWTARGRGPSQATSSAAAPGGGASGP